MRGRRGSIPTSRRLGYDGRCCRLCLNHEVFDGFLSRSQNLGVQMRCNVIALSARVAITLGSRQCEPLVSVGKVFLGADTPSGQYREIVLAVGDAMLCSLAEP